MAVSKTRFTISHIENFFSKLLAKAAVSKNVFIGELPPTTGKDWGDFVLVDVGKQTPNGACSIGYANIYLYARPASGTTLRKNVKALSKMEDALDKAITASKDSEYVLQELYRDSGFDTTRQFHYNMIGVSVIVR